MIEVTHVTKRFAGKVAVDDLSFHVRRGEVVGLLGPNGAGKTTMMRILCGYIPPSSGTVLVGGRDVMTEHLAVRQRIGYLPENAPVYPEMRVDDYLRFRARLKGVRGRRVRRRVNEVKERCGLAEEGRRIIGKLSKGYRQRVCLADALVNDPALLVLDEPSMGLDPNQIRQVRHLIHELGQSHTVLLSTHILSEVEHTCSRVLIINDGRVVASDTSAGLRDLLRGGRRVIAEVHDPHNKVKTDLVAWTGVRNIDNETLPDGWRRLCVSFEDGRDGRTDLFRLALEKGWLLRELRLEERSLEEVFVQLTTGDEEGR